jgi:adenylate cyclase
MAEPALRQILRPLRSWRTRALAIGAGVSLFAAAAGALPFLWSWQEFVDLHVLFRARGERPAPADVVLVPIDARAAKGLFLPAAPDEFERCRDVRSEPLPGYRNPDPPDILSRWPRCLHARALEAFAAAQPKAVVMDISFRPRSDPGQVFAEQDRRLAEAIHKLGNVVLIRKIRLDANSGAPAQPIAGDIEAAAVATAPFLILGDQLQRADKFCTFMEAGPWSGPCLPAVVHQLVSLESYPLLHKLLGTAGSKNLDLIPAAAGGLLAQGSLQAPVRLLRHLATSDVETSSRLRAAVAVQDFSEESESVALRRLTEVYVGSATRYFNFYGPPGAFATLRYESLVADAHANRFDPATLRGKIVFIGFAEHQTPEPIEHFTTPFTTTESVKLSGVELAATAFANLRDGSAIEPAPWWLGALIVLSIGLCCTALCVLFPPAPAIMLSLLVAAAYFAGAVIVFERYAAWLPLLIPLGVALPSTLGAGLAARFVEREEDLDHRDRVISVVLPPAVVRRIIDENAELADLEQRVHGACVSTDIQDYTRWAARRRLEEIRAVLDEYFAELKRVASEFGVDSTDTEGDSMMAVWTDPWRDKTRRAQVCAAALALAETARRFHRRHPRWKLSTRIGAHYGRINIAMSGGPIQKEYRAVGDVPNTAARLQQLSKDLGTQVLVSGALIRGIKGFRARDLGHVRLRGKTDTTHVYELVGFLDSVPAVASDFVRKGTSAKSA